MQAGFELCEHPATGFERRRNNLFPCHVTKERVVVFGVKVLNSSSSDLTSALFTACRYCHRHYNSSVEGNKDVSCSLVSYWNLCIHSFIYLLMYLVDTVVCNRAAPPCRYTCLFCGCTCPPLTSTVWGPLRWSCQSPKPTCKRHCKSSSCITANSTPPR